MVILLNVIQLIKLIMEETLVSFKLAKLAKKAGFKDVINTSVSNKLNK